jgi:hypothetical protein
MFSFARRLCVVLAAAVMGAACGGGEEAAAPLVTPTVTISRPSAPIGSPVEMTYRFVVADGASFSQDYRVFVHFLDADREVMWTDDHDPPVPTSQWKGGERIEYTRTLFIPKFPYIGEATVQVGLHSATTGERVVMDAPTRGLREYDVATFNMVTQSENLVVVFRDGWQRTETASTGTGTEWQWSMKDGVLAFRNPRQAATLFLELDQPVTAVGAQQVDVRIGDQLLDSFAVAPGPRVLRRIAIAPEQMGGAEAVEVTLSVARTFIPAEMPELNSSDKRELGVRVFRAYVETE